MYRISQLLKHLLYCVSRLAHGGSARVYADMVFLLLTSTLVMRQ